MAADNQQDIVTIAHDLYGDDDIQIYADAEVRQAGNDGYWVEAWVWIPILDDND